MVAVQGRAWIKDSCHTQINNTDDDCHCFTQSWHSPTIFPHTGPSRTFYAETAGLQVRIWMNYLLLASWVSAVDMFLLEKPPYRVFYWAKSCIRVTALSLTWRVAGECWALCRGSPHFEKQFETAFTHGRGGPFFSTGFLSWLKENSTNPFICSLSHSLSLAHRKHGQFHYPLAF